MRVAPRFALHLPVPSTLRRASSWLERIAVSLVTIIVILAGVAQLLMAFGQAASPALESLVTAIQPYDIVNSYGLFAVMTTTWHEIIIEGSNDGQTWLAYGFKYKPGDLNRPPLWVQLFQPRLDWQLWFAALGSYQDNPWFQHLMIRLLQGSPDVLTLLELNPFPDASLYDYHFTDPAALASTGQWWTRDRLGIYFPAIALNP